MRTPIAISLLSPLFVCTLLLSCGAAAVRRDGVARAAQTRLAAGLPLADGELTLRPDAVDEPPLELRFAYPNERSTLAWGGVHLWARPRHDQLTISALLDAPSAHQRWGECRTIEVRIDRRVRTIEATYVGRPMDMDGAAGHYDAVLVRFDLIALRDMARAERVVAVACGDRFELSAAQRENLQRFVEWFDVLSRPEQLRDEPWYRDVGPDPERLPLEQDERERVEG